MTKPLDPSLLDGKKLVYQGGHHSVYCDGASHVWIMGGWASSCINKVLMRRGKCDCAYWKNKNG